MIRPNTPGIARKSAATKKASLPSMFGSSTPAWVSALATQPPLATTSAAMGISTSITVVTALRESFTERADSSRITMPWFRK